jgi:hypothetical protein
MFVLREVGFIFWLFFEWGSGDRISGDQNWRLKVFMVRRLNFFLIYQEIKVLKHYLDQRFPTWETRPRGCQRGGQCSKKWQIWMCFFCKNEKYVFWVASTNDIIMNSYIKSHLGLLRGAQLLLGGTQHLIF